MEKIEIYDAKVGTFKEFDLKSDRICINCNDDYKEIIGVRYKNSLFDINTGKEYKILVKEDSNEVELGVDFDNIYLDTYYIFYLKSKANIDSFSMIKAHRLLKDLPDTERIYTCTLEQIDQIEIKNEQIYLCLNPDDCEAIGIIRNNMFIDLSDGNRKYKLAELRRTLFSINAYKELEQGEIYASHVVEQDDEDVINYVNKANTYDEAKESKKKIIKFKK